jgi:mannose-1-phosphate guanylyltransferase
MKAVVLAGGYATRLRPISYVLPKLLFPVAGKPMIHWTLDLLKKFRVDEVVLGVNYLADALRNRVGDEYHGMRIKYSLEELPLGTAGPIKLASKRMKLTDTFIAMNGDIIANINLNEMLNRHTTSHAAVTDALHEVDDPSQFGVVEVDSMSRIMRFVEKPSREETFSKLVNAGVYLVNRSVLGMIPSGQKVSLERDIFPVLAHRRKLGGFIHSDYWFDIGSISDYKNANFALMKTYDDGTSQEQANFAKYSKLATPFVVGKDVKASREVRVGPNVVIGDGVRLGRRCRISNSIIFDHVNIGMETRISGAIVASDSFIGKKVTLEPESIISPNVIVRDGVRIGKGAIVHPYKKITENVKPWTQIM